MIAVRNQALLDEEIDEQRTDASQREWERHRRVHGVLQGALAGVITDLRTATTREAVRDAVDRLEGIAEVLGGEWLQAPAERTKFAPTLVPASGSPDPAGATG